MNTKILLLTLLASTAIFATFMYQTTQQSDDLKMDSTYTFWDNDYKYLCNVYQGCSYGGDYKIANATSNTSMIQTVQQVVGQSNDTYIYFSWNTQNNGLYRRDLNSSVSYKPKCVVNSTEYVQAIKCY